MCPWYICAPIHDSIAIKFSSFFLKISPHDKSNKKKTPVRWGKWLISICKPGSFNTRHFLSFLSFFFPQAGLTGCFQKLVGGYFHLCFSAEHACFYPGYGTNCGAPAVLLFRAVPAPAVLLLATAVTARPKHLRERSNKHVLFLYSVGIYGGLKYAPDTTCIIKCSFLLLNSSYQVYLFSLLEK